MNFLEDVKKIIGNKKEMRIEITSISVTVWFSEIMFEEVEIPITYDLLYDCAFLDLSKIKQKDEKIKDLSAIDWGFEEDELYIAYELAEYMNSHGTEMVELMEKTK